MLEGGLLEVHLSGPLLVADLFKDGEFCLGQLSVSSSRSSRLRNSAKSFLIIQSLPLENLRHVFLDPCLAGLGLFGAGKMQEITLLPSRRQRFERGFQIRH